MAMVFPQTRTENAGDRFGFSLFIAIAAHALVIFGVGFKLLNQQPSTPSLEITLAQYESDKADPEADFLAQANQQGSGDKQEQLEVTSPEQAHLEDDLQRETLFQQQQEMKPSPTNTSYITTISASQAANTATLEQQEHLEQFSTPQLSQEKLKEITSLKTLLDQKIQSYANKPRVRWINTTSTKQSDEAAYLHEWIKYVEMFGNQNYPQEARRNRIFGHLTLAVVLLPDGSVDTIEIAHSSGERVLDQAAIRIVKMASPFKPLPEALLKTHNRLGIIRTWRFEKDQMSTDLQ